MGERAMTTAATNRRYRPAEAKYMGGAHEMYVTYDLEQKTRGGQSALYPKVKWDISPRGQGLEHSARSKKDGA